METLPTRWERLYEDGKRHQRQREASLHERALQKSLEDEEECTFHPQLSAQPRRRATSEGRRRRPIAVSEPTFRPTINHNMDEQLEAWAHGVAAHERLYGESLCRRERDGDLGNFADEPQRGVVDSRRVDELYLKMQRDINSDGDDPPHHARSARYMEDPAEKIMRLAALQRKYSEHFSFQPEIAQRQPSSSRSDVEKKKRVKQPTPPSDAFLHRLGQDIAREALLGRHTTFNKPTLCHSIDFSRHVVDTEEQRHRSAFSQTLQRSRASWSRAQRPTTADATQSNK